MLILGKRRGREAEKLMEMGSERSQPLHNFTMPDLKWGNQRFLRCMKLNPNGKFSSAVVADRRFSASEVDNGLIGRRRESEPKRWGSIERTERKESFKKSLPVAAGVGGSGRKSMVGSVRDGGIEAVREKLMFDLQNEVDKMQFSILREGLQQQEPPTGVTAEAEAEAARPWNLRTRRAACKNPNGMNDAISIGGGGTVNGGGVKYLKVDERKSNSSPLRAESKSPRLGGDVAAADSPTGEKRARTKFSISLARREIEDDFMEMVRHRPPRRPKKRPKVVQKQLDTLFPGLWLTEVSPEMYRVSDAP